MRESLVPDMLVPTSLAVAPVGVPGWALGINDGDPRLTLSPGPPGLLFGVRNVAAIK